MDGHDSRVAGYTHPQKGSQGLPLAAPTGFQGASHAGSCTNLSIPVWLLSDSADGSLARASLTVCQDVPTFLSVFSSLALLLLP